jgi:hypothetical protein
MSKRAPRRIALRFVAAAAVLVSVSGFAAHETSSKRALPPVEEAANRIKLPSSELAKLQLPHLPNERHGSVLNIDAPMRYGQYVWDDKGVPDGPISVRVDLGAQTISVFRSGHEIGTAVILYGAEEKPTPTGGFNIMQKLKDHRSSLYDADMPYTLRLTGDGISIHGSNVRKGRATHGCVGVPTAFAALLFDEVKTGDKVIVV